MIAVTPAGRATDVITTAPVGTSTATPGNTPVPEPSLPRHYVVLIVIDAARMSYFQLSHLPHIRALMSNGVTYDRAWVGELNSSTPDVHVTFGTGTLPRENGFIGFGWAAPDTRKTVDFRTLLANRAIDPVLRGLAVPSVATRLHQYMPDSISVASSGHKDYAVVGLGGGTATYELYGKTVGKRFIPSFMHAPPPLSPADLKSLTVSSPLPMGAEDRWAFRYASMVAERVRPKLLMMNLPEMDTYGHWRGPRTQDVFRRLMQNVDQGIGQIEDTYRRMGILSRTDFIITADHSMMDSQPAQNWGTLKDAAKAVGAQVVRGDTESGAVWLQDPTRARAVATRLVAMKPKHVQAIFYRSAPGMSYSYTRASPTDWLVSPAVATALEHLVNTTAGQNGPDVWVLYRENYTVVPRNVSGVWKGTHGGATWKVQNVPLIMSGPGILHGIHSRFPARAVDIAPTMERLLGLPPIHRDGVILAEALTQASRSELNAEASVAPQISADVQALQAQSAADDRAARFRLPPVKSPVLTCIRSTPRSRCKLSSSPPPTNQ